MRLLLDTAAVVYAVEFPERLSRRAATALRNLDNALELSAISVAEIAIKAASGKLAFSAVILRKAMDDLGIRHPALQRRSCIPHVRASSTSQRSL